jgi:hypothetical protein
VTTASKPDERNFGAGEFPNRLRKYAMTASAQELFDMHAILSRAAHPQQSETPQTQARLLKHRYPAKVVAAHQHLTALSTRNFAGILKVIGG